MQSMDQQFISWLNARQRDETFDPWEAESCMGYRFLKESGYPVHVCYVKVWVDVSGFTHDLPFRIIDLINWSCNQTPIYRGSISMGEVQDYLRIYK